MKKSGVINLTLLLLIILFSVGSVQARSCNEPLDKLCIELTFETFVSERNDQLSDYKFPENVRVNDYLGIEKIVVVNNFINKYPSEAFPTQLDEFSTGADDILMIAGYLRGDKRMKFIDFKWDKDF